ncbi:spike base protein, RCAP_Rcc01079 family [Brevundimonas diminuta]|uniref:spike base protein, RCAP_Rcc01079 family n=1 Tax=Brevundimonas diminuta TaxID=293 RepID=UPI0013770D25|nr:hypothetical protein [Brevundimonas diminuta]
MPYDPKKDPYAGQFAKLNTPAGRAINITPANADLPEYVKAVRCNGAGNLVFLPAKNEDGQTITLAVLAGETVPVLTRRVLPASTASGIVGFLD